MKAILKKINVSFIVPIVLVNTASDLMLFENIFVVSNIHKCFIDDTNHYFMKQFIKVYSKFTFKIVKSQKSQCIYGCKVKNDFEFTTYLAFQSRLELFP